MKSKLSKIQRERENAFLVCQEGIEILDKRIRERISEELMPSLLRNEILAMCDEAQDKLRKFICDKGKLTEKSLDEKIASLKIITFRLIVADSHLTGCRMFSKGKHTRFGQSMAKMVEKAKNGNNSCLFNLISIDPRWLYENWVKDRINHEVLKENRDFFYCLGQSLSDKKRKAFAPNPRKGNEQLIKTLKSKLKTGGVFIAGIRPETPKEVLNSMIEEGIINPDKHDYSMEGFQKLLKRHRLVRLPT